MLLSYINVNISWLHSNSLERKHLLLSFPLPNKSTMYGFLCLLVVMGMGCKIIMLHAWLVMITITRTSTYLL